MLAEKLKRRLEGGKFRLLNDRMYHGKRLHQKELKLYHVFYDNQTKKWPVNPLDIIMEKIKEKNMDAMIADIGCGEARVASVFKNVSSMDLHPIRDDVMFCDMKQKIPLEDSSMDVAICCLSMMMADIAVPTKEVNRILRMGGYWYVAEVKSRISSVNFLGKRFESLGFEVEYVDASNTQFVLFILKKKCGDIPRTLPRMNLRPCLYRKR